MSSDALKTLFHPFVSGALPLPGPGTRGLFLGARPGFVPPEGFGSELTLVQGFRPDFLALAKAGHTVVSKPDGAGFDLGLVLAARHRGENELRVAEALERVTAGGLVVVVGGKEDGIASLRKRVAELLGVEDSLAKFHGAAFWLRADGRAPDAAAELRRANPALVVEDRYLTRPGMFSHGRVDAGTRLLGEHLPGVLTGAVADFCAGWGYLSGEVLRRGLRPSVIDLYEADQASLEAARENLARIADGVQCGFFWRDLLSEPVERRYDAVLMNPPFHAGRAAEPAIGERLIAAAAKALRPGGRLFMVANRQLPYERTLESSFTRVERLADQQGFKVFGATR